MPEAIGPALNLATARFQTTSQCLLAEMSDKFSQIKADVRKGPNVR